MRKSLVFLFQIIMGVTLLVGCGDEGSNGDSAETTEWQPTTYESVNNIDGITIDVKKGTISSAGLTVILENTSDKQYTYGEYYMLEKTINGSWYQVPIVLDENYGFNDIGYELASSDVSEWTVDWDWLYGNLENGQYRLVKDVLDVREPGDYDTYYLAAEFTIN
ncbi:immunoglobulin-like domain-containing protein [Aquibacillus sediminis]|uniref:immunoglobulin-like domain-containing protein n=1 Tax=Aquibacillus sediminis TaxID=2574734 RepID=UPI0011089ED2|nr:immunoglobulin-like domain-containing protein [Aquibacillus sediminis]